MIHDQLISRLSYKHAFTQMAPITGFLTNQKHTNSLIIDGRLLQSFETDYTAALPLYMIIALFT